MNRTILPQDDRRAYRWHGKTDSQRFEEKFEAVPFGGCWIWTAAINANGYACVWDGEKVEAASRVSYRLYIGEIPRGAFICHHCDNPLCVRPDHLYAGTHKQNMADKMRRGRGAGAPMNSKGEGNVKAKLRVTDVLVIRQSSAGSRELAATFGVNIGTIQSIRSRKTWRHL